MRSDHSNGSDDVSNGFFINKLKVEEKHMKDVKKTNIDLDNVCYYYHKNKFIQEL